MENFPSFSANFLVYKIDRAVGHTC